MRMLTVCFVISSIVMLGAGTIFYITSDFRIYINDQTIFDRNDNRNDFYKNNSFSLSFVNRTACESECKSLGINYDHLSVAPGYSRPVKMNTTWVCDLYCEVKQLEGKQVTLLVSSKSYLGVLVNWLAQSILHASQPVNSILIIAFDSPTHQVLRYKGFHSVYISPDVVVKQRAKFSGIWMTRLTVIRFLNYWNYSVLVFDTDALMIKNIQPLLDRFNTSDIIASGGAFPFEFSRKWNVSTMCMGVIFFKCSAATEQFWMSIKAFGSDLDDQSRINKALDSMNVQWKHINDDIKSTLGITSGNIPLAVTILPETVICRGTCTAESLAYNYVWHKNSEKIGTRKKTLMRSYHIWLLNNDWHNSINSTLKSKQWLLNITSPNI